KTCRWNGSHQRQSMALARSVDVQLELPADVLRSAVGATVSELQLDRALYKPLVASQGFPEYGLTEWTVPGPGRVLLRRRPDALFADGEPVTAPELAGALTQGLRAQGLSGLLRLALLDIKDRGAEV